MPVTPFHLGVGLLGKGIAPGRVSFSAFVASQVVIDCETAYFLLVAHQWPVHRWAHTFAVGTPLGLLVGMAVWSAGLLVRRKYLHLDSHELRLLPCIAGGLLGGASHPLLDGIMHADIRPLRPFLETNPFLGALAISQLHIACIVAATLGAGLLVARRQRTHS